MTTTAEQKTAITTLLSTDLSTVTDDRLMELCLLHKATPDVLPSFTDALAAEITRRFTAAEILADSTMFSVVQIQSNGFDKLANYQSRMYELSTTDANLHDDWFRDNATFFYDLLHDAEALAWLVTQTELVGYISDSTVAFDAVFGSSVATAGFVESVIAMTAVAASSTAMTAVAASSTAMTAVAASSTAMTAVAASSTAMTAVAASSTAMTAVAASSTAMTAVAASSTALSTIVKSTPARNALMGSNTILQDSRVAIYNTVKASWARTKTILQGTSANIPLSTISAALISPVGFVFADLGGWGSNVGTVKVVHNNGVVAAIYGIGREPASLVRVDVVTFNESTFTSGSAAGQAYAELWIPPA